MRLDRPHIVARKSLITAFRLWHLLFFWTIIPPLINIVWRIIVLKNTYVEFYDSYVIKKKGVINKTTEKCMFPKVMACNVHRPWLGRIFNYGNISIDAIGKWDVDLTNIKRPQYIKKYLDKHFISAKEIRAMRQTVITQ